MVSFQFAYTAGLWALLSLVPLILLYLIKPKPKTMAIPSLMFFMRSTGYRKLTSFLRQIIRDWLFIIQLLLLLALALTFAEPFTTYLHDVTASNTVIVLDVSASSQTTEGMSTRFDIGLSKAKQLLSARNTIILAKDVPLLGVKEAGYDEAMRFLNSLQPKETATRLGEAIILAGETLSEGRIVVISDFINTDGQDPQIAKSILETRGLKVEFMNTAVGTKNNAAIISLIADEASTTAYIKNYDDSQKTVTLNFGNSKQQLQIAAHATESRSFQTPPGITKITIEPKDALMADNEAYLSAPMKKQVKALLITNNASVFLRNALTASGDITLEIARPPIIPKSKYDIYVIHNIDPDQILPGTFEDIFSEVKNGATAIIHSQEDTPAIDYAGLNPVAIGGRKEGSAIRIEQLNRFTKNIEFGTAEYILTAQPNTGTLSIAKVENNDVLSIGKQGDGKLIYYGILEKASDFKFSPGYPIFWTELLRFATEQQEIKNLNFATGDTLVLETEQEITTPSRTTKSSTIMLEETGIYTVGDRKLAVNLVNEKESSINTNTSFGTKSINFELKPVKDERKYALEFLLVGAGLVLLIFETIYVKLRGDI